MDKRIARDLTIREMEMLKAGYSVILTLDVHCVVCGKGETVEIELRRGSE